ncbi:histidine phosphatase family protein [Streptococcus himalayensis]|uniref:Phosphoglycerate mutase n=1 Tax=Streptococcus himalayensis TaxID=1888195 RepID=A0A917A835_9STRE|nr:histidine phosphatase family protein [Streptococcus himalayensis]GGE34246.1 phosphoglycerate mutase [Streptococcus himalayensis]
MKLYFVRHGKTEWNVEGRFQGAGGDSPLLTSAVEELKLLGQHLSSIQFERILSSSLPRALASAEIIQAENSYHPPILSCPELNEWRLGSLEGQKFSTLEAIYPQQMNAFRHNLSRFHPSIFGAETVYQTTQRTIQLIKSQKEVPAQNLLFVGHGANLTASLRTLLGYDVALLRKNGGLANSSLTILETDDFEHFQLLTWNNLDHLKEIEMTPLKP